MTDPSSPSIDTLAKDPRFNKVSRKTLERWSKEDSWVERRSQFFNSWAAQARERLGSELAKRRQRDLDDLETIRDLAIAKLTDDMVFPKSWEGVAKILLDATEHRDRIANLLGADMMPNAGAVKPELKPQDVGTTPEELEVMASTLLKHRRDQHRLAAGTLQPAVVVDVIPVAEEEPIPVDAKDAPDGDEQ